MGLTLIARDLYLKLGLGQGHISMHNTRTTTSIPDHVTLGKGDLLATCSVNFSSVSTHGRKFDYFQ